jgi:electron transfer flavoprotein alpha subunit
MPFLVVLQQGDQLRKSCLEAAAAAAKLAAAAGTDLDAVYMGSGFNGSLGQLAGSGIKRVFLFEQPELNRSSEGQLAGIVETLVEEMGHELILGSATTFGREFLASLSARLDAELIQDCIDIEWEEDPIAKKALYGGKVHARIRVTGRPALLSCRPNLFPLNSQGEELPAVERMTAEIDDDGVRFLETLEISEEEAPLTEAAVIVAGGRGIGGADRWGVLELLCSELSAALGASRAAVDSNWISQSHQVGQTGKTVNPELYVACGISGAVQHIAGMMESKVVVAINRDPEAAIFEMCDYGIVGDLFEIVPMLVEKIKQCHS